MSYEKLISALCITYGRHLLLEEAIESFLKQDYPNKEMIIINDLPEQTLIFEHPQIKIFNFKKRFSTIGEKRNKSVEMSKGDILTSWDDDDIYLPWLLSRLVKEFELQPDIGFVQPGKAWYLSNDKIEQTKGWCAHSAFTRESFDKVNGYQIMNSGQDMDLLNRLKKYLTSKRYKEVVFSPEEACYIFRWSGTGSYHLSGYGRDKEGKISGFNKIEEFIKSNPIESIVKLKPHWKKDYLQMTRDFLNMNITTA